MTSGRLRCVMLTAGDVDAQIDDLVTSGDISDGDGDVLHEFAEFLRTHGKPAPPSRSTQ